MDYPVEVAAYKLAIDVDGKVYSPFQPEHEYIRDGLWQRAVARPVRYESATRTRPAYQSGFHVFPHLAQIKLVFDLHRYAVLKVVVRNIEIKGQQRFGMFTSGKSALCDVWVAREMLIPPDCIVRDAWNGS